MKMTQEKIVNALTDCAWWQKQDGDVLIAELMQEAANLIENLQARIDALNETNRILMQSEDVVKKNVRAFTIVEFAERLKAIVTINNTDDGYLDYSIDYNCLMEDINDLVKEMDGVEGGARE